MRRPSEHLYQLIQRLTKEEKKKITIHLKGLGQKGLVHIRLFNAIYKQSEYNEKALKTVIKVNTFSAAKKRLYELIMDVLLLIEKQESVQQKLWKGLEVFDILYKKKLYEKARIHIYELEALAEKNELFHFFPFIYMKMERIEAGIYGYRKYDNKSHEQYLEKRKRNQDKLYNIQDYMLIQSKLRYVTVKYDLDWLDKIKKIQEDPLLTDSENAQSISAKLLYHSFNMNSSLLRSKKDTIAFHAWKTISIFEEHLLEIRTAEDYIVSLFNAMNGLFSINRGEELSDFFAKITKTIPSVKKNKEIYEEGLITFKAKYYAKRGDAENGNKLIDLHVGWTLNKITPYNQTVFFDFGTLYFFNKRYEESRACLNPILDKKYKGNEQVIYWAKLFELVTYFEQEEFVFMESLCRSLYRKLQENKDNYSIELAIVNALKKLTQLNKEEMPKLFKHLYEKLNAFKANSEPQTTALFEYFDYLAWVESKLKKKAMSTVLAESIVCLNHGV